MSGPSEDGEFKVLLIEDEPVIRELVRNVLTQGPVSVDCASDGLEGLKLAKTRAFQLILLDVVLPLLDGISVCRTLKSHPETAGVPLYMLTAKAKRSDVDTAMKAGADGYIHKPFRGTELMELVDRLRVSAQLP
jgi:DNA-binding response OmpR family regulator